MADPCPFETLVEFCRTDTFGPELIFAPTSVYDRFLAWSRCLSNPQLTSALLKVFRCGPRRDVGGRDVAARVDKPRKEEAAGVLDQAMGKVRGRLGRLLRLECGGSFARCLGLP